MIPQMDINLKKRCHGRFQQFARDHLLVKKKLLRMRKQWMEYGVCGQVTLINDCEIPLSEHVKVVLSMARKQMLHHQSVPRKRINTLLLPIRL
jgi:hypothetical protein